MKKLTLSFCGLLFSSLVYADTPQHTAKVLGNVSISVSEAANGYQTEVVKSYKTNDIIPLKDSDLICFKAGQGQISIDQGKQQLGQADDCVTVIAVSKRGFIAFMGEKITTFNPFTAKGVSSKGGIRGGNTEPSQKQQIIDKVYKEGISTGATNYVVINTSEWMNGSQTLPLTLRLLKPNRQTVFQQSSNTTGSSMFILPPSLIHNKNGYSIKITDKDGIKLMYSTLTVKQ